MSWIQDMLPGMEFLGSLHEGDCPWCIIMDSETGWTCPTCGWELANPDCQDCAL